VYGDDRPLHSWRVLLLPFIEQKELYEEFRLNEPWNSEHNLRLLGRMPSLYEAPWTRRVNVPPGHTVYHVLVGPGTPFEVRSGLRLPNDFPDGTSNTILFVEAGPPVPWTKPEEIGFDPGRTVNLQGLFRDGFRACSADGKYRFVRRESDQATIRAALTRDGGEQPPDW
jgi:hypothetical protein